MSIIIRVIVSILLLSLFFYKFDTGRILERFVSLNIFLFVICLFFMVTTLLIGTFRWHIFLKADNSQVPFVKLFSFYMVGLFFNNLLPSAVGGDVVRGYEFYRYSGDGKAAVVSVFMERLTALTVQVLFAFMGVLVGYSYFREPLILWLVCGMSLSYLFFIIILFNKRMVIFFLDFLTRLRLIKTENSLYETYRLFLRYRSRRKAMFRATMLSFLIIIVSIFTFYYLSIAMHLSIPFGYFILFLPIMNIVSMLPVTLGGLGIREGIGVFLFSKVGVAHSDAFGLSLAWSSVLILVSIIGGVIFILRPTKGIKLNPKDDYL